MAGSLYFLPNILRQFQLERAEREFLVVDILTSGSCLSPYDARDPDCVRQGLGVGSLGFDRLGQLEGFEREGGGEEEGVGGKG